MSYIFHTVLSIFVFLARYFLRFSEIMISDAKFEKTQNFSWLTSN